MTSRDDEADSFMDSDTLDHDFFIGIVECKLKIRRDEFKLRLVLLSPVTGKNENYASVLYRAKIKIEIIATKERKSIDVIIKALLSSMKEMKEYNVFPRERFVYQNFLCKFEKIWFDESGEVIQFGPRSVKFETDPYEIIVLDDLKADGYEMMNRKVGLNKEQTKMVLMKLAKFHATSAIRLQKDGVIDNKLFDRKTMMAAVSREKDFMENLLEAVPEENDLPKGPLKMFRAFAKAIREYGGYETYAGKIDQWNTSKLLSQWVDVADPMECGFKVLNHGDIWSNNVMFKSDKSGNLLEALLIDYQGSFWASPSHDILLFLLLSVSDDIKVDCFDEFVELYHTQLAEALRSLKYDQHIPTLEELQADLRSKGSFGIKKFTNIFQLSYFFK